MTPVNLKTVVKNVCIVFIIMLMPIKVSFDLISVLIKSGSLKVYWINCCSGGSS
jgi:hypothetical protein